MPIPVKVVLSPATEELPCRNMLIERVKYSLHWRHRSIEEKGTDMMLASFELTLSSNMRQFYFAAIIMRSMATAVEQPSWEVAVATKAHWIRLLGLDENSIDSEDRDFHEN